MAKDNNGNGKDRVCGNCDYCRDITPGEDIRENQGTCYGAPPQVILGSRMRKVTRAGEMPFEQIIQALNPPVKLQRPGCCIFKPRVV